MDFQVAWKREAGKDSTADLYRVVRNRLYRFWKGASLQWTDITAAMVDDFGSSLRAEGAGGEYGEQLPEQFPGTLPYRFAGRIAWTGQRPFCRVASQTGGNGQTCLEDRGSQ